MTHSGHTTGSYQPLHRRPIGFRRAVIMVGIVGAFASVTPRGPVALPGALSLARDVLLQHAPSAASLLGAHTAEMPGAAHAGGLLSTLGALLATVLALLGQHVSPDGLALLSHWAIFVPAAAVLTWRLSKRMWSVVEHPAAADLSLTAIALSMPVLFGMPTLFGGALAALAGGWTTLVVWDNRRNRRAAMRDDIVLGLAGALIAMAVPFGLGIALSLLGMRIWQRRRAPLQFVIGLALGLFPPVALVTAVHALAGRAWLTGLSTLLVGAPVGLWAKIPAAQLVLCFAPAALGLIGAGWALKPAKDAGGLVQRPALAAMTLSACALGLTATVLTGSLGPAAAAAGVLLVPFALTWSQYSEHRMASPLAAAAALLVPLATAVFGTSPFGTMPTVAHFTDRIVWRGWLPDMLSGPTVDVALLAALIAVPTVAAALPWMRTRPVALAIALVLAGAGLGFGLV